MTVEVGPHRPALFAGADLVVLSPGVPAEQEAVQAARRAGVPVIGEIEMASRWLSGRVIAITGTKGKSTTTTLTARMLQEAGFDATAGGNLGTALSTQVAQIASRRAARGRGQQLPARNDRHVSSVDRRAAESVAGSPRSSSDRSSAYAAAKARVFANQTADDWAVVNADDPASMALAGGGRARRFDFALDADLTDGVTVEARTTSSGAMPDGSAPLVPLSSVRLPGRHLLGDVLAAAAVGCVAGVPPAAMQRAVEGFARTAARARARGRHRRRGVRQRLEGHEHRVRAPRAREFCRRRGRDHGRPLQGRRFRRPARRRARARDRRSSRLARRRRSSRPRSATRSPVTRAASMADAVAAAFGAGRAGRRRAARAGVLELRHVHGLRGPRRAVSRSRAVEGEVEGRA